MKVGGLDRGLWQFIKKGAVERNYTASYSLASGRQVSLEAKINVLSGYTVTAGAGTVICAVGAVAQGLGALAQSGTGRAVGVFVGHDASATTNRFIEGILIEADAVREAIRVGEFASAAVGSGVVLSSTYTASNRFYSDDGGSALSASGSVPDYRNLLARTLITADNSANHLRLASLMGHLKSYDGEWGTEQVAGVFGYMELVRGTGTINFQGYGKTAGVIGCVETSGTMTIDANHIVAGVAAISKLAGSGLTQTGKSVGVLVDIYDTTNWSDATARSKWQYGLYIPARAATNGMLIGDFASAAAGSGIPMSNTVTAAARVYSDDGGSAISSATSVPDVRGFISRTLVTTDNSSNHLRLTALMGHVKSYDGEWGTEQVGSVYGYLELVRNAGTINYQGYGKSAGVVGCVETSGTMTIDANHIVAGVAAISKLAGSGLTQTGKTCGLLVDIYDTTNWSDATARSKWQYGLYIPARAVTNGALFGDFSSATAGSGLALSASVTAGVRVYSDDGGAKIAAGEVRGFITRTLLATADTDQTDHSISAGVSQIKVAAAHTSNGNIAGACGYLEVAAGITFIGGRRAQMSVASGVWARVDLPATAVVGADGIVSGVAISANLGGTHTGACSMINVTTPSAGTWDYFLDFGATPGAIVADTSNLPAAATYKIKCRYDTTDFYLIGVADF